MDFGLVRSELRGRLELTSGVFEPVFLASFDAGADMFEKLAVRARLRDEASRRNTHKGEPNERPPSLGTASCHFGSASMSAPSTQSSSVPFVSRLHLSFDPGLDFQDLDVGESRPTTVSYLIDDGNGGTDMATVTLTVSG